METMLYLISNAVGIYLVYLCIKVFYADYKINKYIEFALFCFLFIITSCVYLIFNNPLYNGVANIVTILLITIYYNLNNLNNLNLKTIFGAIGVTCVSFVVAAMLETVIVIIVDSYNPTWQNSMTATEFSEELQVYLISLFLNFMFMFVLRFFINIRYTDGLSIKYKMPLIIIPIISYYIVVSLLLSSSIDRLTMLITLILFFVLNLVFFWMYNIIGKFYKENMDNVIIQKENEAFLKQMEFAKMHQTRTAQIKHDINKHLRTVSDYIKEEHTIKAQEYIKEVVHQTEEIEVLSKSGNILFDTVLNNILTQCKANNIEVVFKENIPDEFSKIADIDLNSILYNVFDNAIAATCKLPSDKRRINIKIDYNKKVLIFKVKNTFDGIVKKDKNDNLISRKSDKTAHGYGMKNINNIVDKYGGNIKIDYDTSMFSFVSLLYDC